MSENKSETSQAKSASQAQEKTVEQAPVRVGRQQLGEKVEGAVTSRAPRGVGEPASDAKSDEEGVRLTQESVQKQVDEETAKGYRGQQVSSVPNSHYTVAGVTSGKPTPETTVYTPRG